MDIYLIDEASDFILDCGMKFSETSAGHAVLEMARAYAKLQDEKFTKPRMPANEFISRKEDMSTNGCLRLIKQDDGDICVAIINKEGDMVSVEFCAPGDGGGKSPKTLDALNNLAVAIMHDNGETPSRAGC